MPSSKISIIIPVFNAVNFIDKAVKSIQSQNYQNWECILVDDGSTDKSLNQLKKLASEDDRLLVLTQSNQGPGHARNHGLTHATGKYVMFLDSDDAFLPKAFQRLVTEAEKWHGECIIYGRFRWLDPSNITPEGLSDYLPGPRKLKDILIHHTTPNSSMLIPRVKLPTPAFSGDVYYNEDWYCWLSMAQAGVTYRSIDFPVCKIFARPESRSNATGNWKQLIEDGLKILENLEQKEKEDGYPNNLEDGIFTRVKNDFIHTHSARGLAEGSPDAMLYFQKTILSDNITPEEIVRVTGVWHASYAVRARLEQRPTHPVSNEWFNIFKDWLNSSEAKSFLTSDQIQSFTEIWSRRQLTNSLIYSNVQAKLKTRTSMPESLIIAGLGKNGKSFTEYLKLKPFNWAKKLLIWDDNISENDIQSLGYEKFKIDSLSRWPENTVVLMTPLVYSSFHRRLKELPSWEEKDLLTGATDSSVNLDLEALSFPEKKQLYKQLHEELLIDTGARTENPLESWDSKKHLPMSMFFMIDMLPTIMKYLREMKGNIRIADIGCGMGGGTQLLAQLLQSTFTAPRQIEVYGFDNGLFAERYNQTFNHNMHFELNSLDNIPTEAQFDITICSNMLEHFKDPRPLINKLKEITSSYVIIMVPYDEVPGTVEDHLVRFTDDLVASFEPIEIKTFPCLGSLTEQVLFVLELSSAKNRFISEDQENLFFDLDDFYQNIDNYNSFAFYGAGKDLKAISSHKAFKSEKLIGVFDDSFEQNRVHSGLKVLSPSEIAKINPDAVFITSSHFKKPIMNQLVQIKDQFSLKTIIK